MDDEYKEPERIKIIPERTYDPDFQNSINEIMTNIVSNAYLDLYFESLNSLIKTNFTYFTTNHELLKDIFRTIVSLDVWYKEEDIPFQVIFKTINTMLQFVDLDIKDELADFSVHVLPVLLCLHEYPKLIITIIKIVPNSFLHFSPFIFDSILSVTTVIEQDNECSFLTFLAMIIEYYNSSDINYELHEHFLTIFPPIWTRIHDDIKALEENEYSFKLLSLLDSIAPSSNLLNLILNTKLIYVMYKTVALSDINDFVNYFYSFLAKRIANPTFDKYTQKIFSSISHYHYLHAFSLMLQHSQLANIKLVFSFHLDFNSTFLSSPDESGFIVSLYRLIQSSSTNEKMLYIQIINEIAEKRGVILNDIAFLHSVIDMIQLQDANHNGLLIKIIREFITLCTIEEICELKDHLAADYDDVYEDDQELEELISELESLTSCSFVE